MSNDKWGDQIKSIRDFIIILSTKNDFLAAFIENKNTIIDKTTLPEDEKELLKRGDAQSINDLISYYLPESSRKDYSTLAHGHDIWNCTN